MEKMIKSLCMGREKGQTRMALEIEGKVKVAHLYLVTIQDKATLETYQNHVIAPNEKEAIEQCDRRYLPDEEFDRQFAATAVQIPVIIRGWGGQTF